MAIVCYGDWLIIANMSGGGGKIPQKDVKHGPVNGVPHTLDGETALTLEDSIVHNSSTRQLKVPSDAIT